LLSARRIPPAGECFGLRAVIANILAAPIEPRLSKIAHFISVDRAALVSKFEWLNPLRTDTANELSLTRPVYVAEAKAFPD
jgi:hypothetical protein